MSIDWPLLRMVIIALLVGFVVGGCVWYGWEVVGGLRRALAQRRPGRDRASGKPKQPPAPAKRDAGERPG
ncbi:MAG TPA: hypothetical protein PKI11_15375 [Candidatus Hydrogenedentes bacterium]|nr:hypothetical protein [Candidatus Hydrogenedentota bacterium]